MKFNLHTGIYHLKTDANSLLYSTCLKFRSYAPCDRDIVLKPVISDFKLSYFFIIYLFVLFYLAFLNTYVTSFVPITPKPEGFRVLGVETSLWT